MQIISCASDLRHAPNLLHACHVDLCIRDAYHVAPNFRHTYHVASDLHHAPNLRACTTSCGPKPACEPQTCMPCGSHPWACKLCESKQEQLLSSCLFVWIQTCPTASPCISCSRWSLFMHVLAKTIFNLNRTNKPIRNKLP